MYELMTAVFLFDSIQAYLYSGLVQIASVCTSGNDTATKHQPPHPMSVYFEADRLTAEHESIAYTLAVAAFGSEFRSGLAFRSAKNRSAASDFNGDA